jgi:hypothetical protein
MISPITVTVSPSEWPSSSPTEAGPRCSSSTPDSSAMTVANSRSIPDNDSTAYSTIGNRPHTVGGCTSAPITALATNPAPATT